MSADAAPAPAAVTTATNSACADQPTVRTSSANASEPKASMPPTTRGTPTSISPAHTAPAAIPRRNRKASGLIVLVRPSRREAARRRARWAGAIRAIHHAMARLSPALFPAAKCTRVGQPPRVGCPSTPTTSPRSLAVSSFQRSSAIVRTSGRDATPAIPHEKQAAALPFADAFAGVGPNGAKGGAICGTAGRVPRQRRVPPREEGRVVLGGPAPDDADDGGFRVGSARREPTASAGCAARVRLGGQGRRPRACPCGHPDCRATGVRELDLRWTRPLDG